MIKDESRAAAAGARRRSAWPLFLALVVAAGLGFGALTTGHSWGGDFATYIMQARSLVQGEPSSVLDANQYFFERSVPAGGTLAYPWGFPAILSPIYAVFGLQMIALKAVGLACFLLFLIAAWRAVEQRHSPGWAAVVLVTLAANPALIGSLDNVTADIPFLALSTAAVALIGVSVVERRTVFGRLLDPVLLGAVVAAAYAVRSNGVLLLPTLAVAQAGSLVMRWSSTKREHDAPKARVHGVLTRDFWLAGLPYVTFVTLVVIWHGVLPDSGLSYVRYLDGIELQTVRQNLLYYARLPASFFTAAPLEELVYGATIPCAVAGMIARRRTDYPAILYVALTFALYCFWPFQQGLRFLFPVLPFYLSFVVSGLEVFQRLPRGPERTARRLACSVPTGVVLAAFVLASGGLVRENLANGRGLGYGPFTQESQSLFAFIRTNVRSDHSVTFWKPRVMTLMTDRPARRIATLGGLTEQDDYLCVYRDFGRGTEDGWYRLNDADSVSIVSLNALAASGGLEMVFANSHFRLYEVLRVGD